MNDLSKIAIKDKSFQVFEVIKHLQPLVTEERDEKIKRVIAHRTLEIVPVVENLYDRGNVSAVMRTAEGLGFQNMHVIQPGVRFKEANRVTQGADKWLDIHQWKSTSECINHLKGSGFKICVTTFEGAKPISEIDFLKPTAVVFGNEKEGASAEILEMADEKMLIPMSGFIQSFNISVAAALTFYHIRQQRDSKWQGESELNSAQQNWLYASYLLKTVGHATEILERSII